MKVPADELIRLDGKVALVTGASWGLGRAIAELLAIRGADVALTSRDATKLKETASLVEQAGRKALCLTLDQRDTEAIEPTVKAVVEHFGRLDILVNNAGVHLKKPAVDVTRDEWDLSMETNLRGPFFLCQAAARHWIAHGLPGRIVNIASTHGLVGFAERIAYGTAKGGLIQMTRMLAIEWARYGITVNAVAPGTIPHEGRPTAFHDPAHAERMLSRIPLGRFGSPRDAAEAVAYLASDAAAFITGQVLAVDGGTTVW